MIVVRIMAGLGNQMLQYALGRRLSIKYNSPLYLDLSWFDSNKNPEHPRDYRLDCFHTQYQTVDINKIIWRLRYTDHFKTINPFKLTNIKDKDEAGFDESILQAGDNILLEGFFPCYKYFEPIRDILLKEFTPVKKMDNENETCLQKIKSTNSVSVHFRRGDYAHTDFHGMLDKNYYEKAIHHIAQKTGNLQLFIFSDEPGWVQENMSFGHPYELISFNKDEHNYFDMELMKHCKHNIIANSTFSWWPAWLNEYTEKIVVAPERWFNQEKKTGALIPGSWVSL